MTNLLTGKAPSRITLDLARLVAEGRMTPEEADRLIGLAAPNRMNHVLANILFIFGAFMSVAGVLTLEPPLDVGLALALAALGIGSVLVFRAREEWGLFGQTLVLMGILGISGWAALRFEDLGGFWPSVTAPLIAALTLGGAVLYRNGVLAALAPIAIANLIGTGTGYWHASYALFVDEAAVSIVIFGVLAGGILALRPYLPQAHELNAIIMARVSFFLANFGFWIGSLWGDFVGELWLAPNQAGYEQVDSWRDHALFIAPGVFSVAWLVFLAVCIFVGLKMQRRFIANTALVFLAIHFYTQLFETLQDAPGALVIAGLSLVGFGLGLARFDRWQRERTSAAAPNA